MDVSLVKDVTVGKTSVVPMPPEVVEMMRNPMGYRGSEAKLGETYKRRDGALVTRVCGISRRAWRNKYLWMDPRRLHKPKAVRTLNQKGAAR